MKKETLTLMGIRDDLLKMVDYNISNEGDWRFCYIVPITALAILVGVLAKSILIGIAIFSVAAYHIVRYVKACKDYKAKKAAILMLIWRSEISISKQTFSHISNDYIYEPHMVGKNTHSMKMITNYNFKGGSSWRVPVYFTHYEWSREFYLSTKGLENFTIEGDEFYFVLLQSHPDISYVYPCKIFQLDKSLEL